MLAGSKDAPPERGQGPAHHPEHQDGRPKPTRTHQYPGAREHWPGNRPSDRRTCTDATTPRARRWVASAELHEENAWDSGSGPPDPRPPRAGCPGRLQRTRPRWCSFASEGYPSPQGGSALSAREVWEDAKTLPGVAADGDVLDDSRPPKRRASRTVQPPSGRWACVRLRLHGYGPPTAERTGTKGAAPIRREVSPNLEGG